MSESDSVTYGINYRSPLNDLFSFHVADGQLPQDVMHLLLEGVIPYELKLMLREFTAVKKYFTVDDLNNRIRSFNYSPEEAKDKPPPIKAHDLTGNGKISMAGMLNINNYVFQCHNIIIPCSRRDVDICCIFAFNNWLCNS
jgi:hypothetical protein